MWPSGHAVATMSCMLLSFDRFRCLHCSRNSASSTARAFSLGSIAKFSIVQVGKQLRLINSELLQEAIVSASQHHHLSWLVSCRQPACQPVGAAGSPHLAQSAMHHNLLCGIQMLCNDGIHLIVIIEAVAGNVDGPADVASCHLIRSSHINHQRLGALHTGERLYQRLAFHVLNWRSHGWSDLSCVQARSQSERDSRNSLINSDWMLTLQPGAVATDSVQWTGRAG
mmetsp:Transcript_4473/g.12891  ORF Transcript_4473/g.12891 Transcript_4473/m.12891 type:complete len:226 (-) Transcript_4473:40-717(-)